MRKFADLYKNKLMKITFTNNNAEQIFYNEIGTHIPEDYFDCKNIFIRHGLSTAFYIKNSYFAHEYYSMNLENSIFDRNQLS